eukprot:gene6851-7620_t
MKFLKSRTIYSSWCLCSRKRRGFLITKQLSTSTQTSDSILVLNPGSTSLKCSVYSTCDLKTIFSPPPLFTQNIKLTQSDCEDEVTEFLDKNAQYFHEIKAVGIRCVHAGRHFKETTHITNSVLDILRSVIPLAPLHMPRFFSTLASVCKFLPDAPCYAAFDTQFYSEIPDHARLYPLPFHLASKGIMKYGFHGLNHRYCCEKLSEGLGDVPSRLVTCHLGGGSSVSAIKDRVCIDTSMGYTPLDGVMMTSRSGSLDPSIVLQLVRDAKGDVGAVEKMLNGESGIRGVTGLRDVGFKDIVDMYDRQAVLAYNMFLDRLCKAIGSYTAVLKGIDGLVFSGGIGENSTVLRRDIAEQLSYLGIQLDDHLNEKNLEKDRIISHKDSAVKVAVIHANEELVIAKDVSRLTTTPSFDI